MKTFLNPNRIRLRAPLNAAFAALQRRAVCAPFGYAACTAFACLLAAAPLSGQSPAPAPAVAPVPAPPADSRPETVISSDELDMVGGDEANHFYFRGNVKVQATNMIATADELEVISARQTTKGGEASAAGASSATSGSAAAASGTGASASGSGTASGANAGAASAPRGGASADAAAPNIGSIREIIMRGNVVISQEGRRATAGIAYLYPQEGRVVLADNPKVTDAQGTLSGWRMELYRGERKVRILSNPDEKQRTRVTLPALQDLGYNELGDSAAPAPEAQPATPNTGSVPNAAPAADAGSATPAGGSAAPATTSGQPAAVSSASSQAAASPSGAGEPAAASTTPAKPEEAEPAPRERSGGWNPVNSRRR